MLTQRTPEAAFVLTSSIMLVLLAGSGCGPTASADYGEPSESSGYYADAGGGNNGGQDPYGGADAGVGGRSADAAGNPDEESDDETETWKRSEIVPHASKISVGENRDLQFRGMQAHVQIDGFRARVLIDYYFYNPDQRRYEGTFKVRLPDGGSPYFLAFGASKFKLEPDEDPNYEKGEDVRKRGFSSDEIMQNRKEGWIDAKEARIVPKKKAARAYKQEVSKRVDPALAEWAGPGMFNARLFPIQPGKLHRVVFGYDVNLNRIDDALEYHFPVPKDVPSSVIDIEVTNMKGAKVEFKPKTVAVPGKDKKWAHYEYDAPKENKRATIRIENPGTLALTGSKPKTGDYFATRFEPAIKKTKAKNPTERAVFVVDTSMSANPDRFNIWRKLMKATLENNRGQLKEFAVMFFNVETFWWKEKFVQNTEQNTKALMSYIDELALEGASDIGAALDTAGAPSWYSQGKGYDLFLLSDGNATWGNDDKFALSLKLKESSGSTLFAYRTGISGDNTSMLRHLARQSGGAVFSVVGEKEIKAASTAHTYRPWTIDGVDVKGAKDLILAGRPKTVFPGQRLTLVGRGKIDGETEVSVDLKRGLQTKTVRESIDQAIPSPFASRTYGQIAVGQLEDFLGSTRRFAQAYARHFRVARKSSSLLMLESEEDYREYNIEPKADAKLVNDKLVSDLVRKALEEMIATLGNAKASFLDWIEELKDVPGVKLSPSKAFRSYLSNLPRTSFEVDPEPLDCKSHAWKRVDDKLEKQLEKQKPTYDTVMADARERKKNLSSDDALKALSSLVEAHPGRTVVARDVGFTAMGWGHYGQAYDLFRKVAHARPFEPQTYHQAALTLDEAGNSDLALAYFELALSGNWDARFGNFRKIVRLDYLRFLRSTPMSEFTAEGRTLAKKRTSQLGSSIGIDKADLVVTITWNTDATDVDLHIVEPSGEEVYYEHPESQSTGGKLTDDVTEGYGPEMYVLENAPSGKFEIFARYYEDNRNRAGTRTKAYATVYRDWGTKSERVLRKTVTLEAKKQDSEIATLEMK